MESPQLFAEYHGLNLALPYTVADVKRSVNTSRERAMMTKGALNFLKIKEWLENRGTLPVMKYSGSSGGLSPQELSWTAVPAPVALARFLD